MWELYLPLLTYSTVHCNKCFCFVSIVLSNLMLITLSRLNIRELEVFRNTIYATTLLLNIRVSSLLNGTNIITRIIRIKGKWLSFVDNFKWIRLCNIYIILCIGLLNLQNELTAFLNSSCFWQSDSVYTFKNFYPTLEEQRLPKHISIFAGASWKY